MDLSALPKKMIDVFENANVEIIVTNAAGCGSNVKEYGHLLRDDASYASALKPSRLNAGHHGSLIRASATSDNPLKMRVAFHDSCHLQHAQGVRSQPRQLLEIFWAGAREIPESAICCSRRGFTISCSRTLPTRWAIAKLILIVPLNAQVIATGNPGYLLQVQSLLAFRAWADDASGSYHSDS